MRTIPRAPARLRLPIERLWNGAPGPEGTRGAVELSLVGDELEMRAELRQPQPPRVPENPAGTRVEGLWAYDVVECFLLGAGGRYLEIELGARGHYLVLSFRARRVRASGHEHLAPRVHCGTAPDGAWWVEIRVPRTLVPARLRGVNAFAIVGGRCLAHHPVPGEAPDFHQPDTWPRVRLGE
jgi:hypothetical protein